ncbi:hypothetical protein WMY93_003533 [Mugilogobius chulae]|uniref:Uncharacterized protein n=1 Tax=Mugilogobius chulae TaxID=88201 RepID=A0AAW0Q6R8_9GOBI
MTIKHCNTPPSPIHCRAPAPEPCGTLLLSLPSLLLLHANSEAGHPVCRLELGRQPLDKTRQDIAAHHRHADLDKCIAEKGAEGLTSQLKCPLH